MKSRARSAHHSAFNRFYKRIKQPACIYCGLRATTKDHFVPLSVVGMLAAVGTVTGKFLLPSCGECNGIAGNAMFNTVAAKRRYIHERLKKKYRKVLEMPDWTDAEKGQIGWSLRTTVEAGMAQKNVLTQRLAWRNTSNATFVDIAKIRSGLLARGHDGAPQSAE